MATKIYGCSDDLVEIDGDLDDEVECYGYDEGVLVVCSDGTVLRAKYGKDSDGAIWAVTLDHAGSLFDRIDVCTDEDAEPCSDVAHFKDGLQWAYVTREWELVTGSLSGERLVKRKLL